MCIISYRDRLNLGLPIYIYIWSTPKSPWLRTSVPLFRQIRKKKNVKLRSFDGWSQLKAYNLAGKWLMVEVPRLACWNRLALQYHMNCPLVIKRGSLENHPLSQKFFLSTDARVVAGCPSQPCLITAGYSTQCGSLRNGEGKGYGFITFKKLEEAKELVGYYLQWWALSKMANIFKRRK